MDRLSIDRIRREVTEEMTVDSPGCLETGGVISPEELSSSSRSGTFLISPAAVPTTTQPTISSAAAPTSFIPVSEILFLCCITALTVLDVSVHQLGTVELSPTTIVLVMCAIK